MKIAGWMLSLLGSIAGLFTGWAESLPRLQMQSLLPQGIMPAWDMTFAASLLGLMGVAVMWLRHSRLGGLLVIVAAIGGVFGAGQLWTIAGCTLFSGSILAIFSGQTHPTSKESA